MATFPTNVSGGVALPVSVANGGTGAITAAAAAASLGATPTLGPIYGGGAHGAFDLDGTNTYAAYFTKSGSQYTQIADVRATTFRVRSGVTLLPSQFWIYAEVTFVNEGTIRNNGNAATLGTAGAGIGALGTIQTTGIVGAAGRTTAGVGAAGTGGTNATGGAGGQGGTSGGANTGGLGGVGVAILATSQGIGTPIFRQSHRVMLAASTLQSVNAGAGGGAGGATLNTGTATSGGGGGGASGIRINARSFDNTTGTITCTGGAGGNATVTGDAVAGGGGGGGGGTVGVLADVVVAFGSATAAGGAGGTGAGTGSASGSTGSAGLVSLMTPTGTTNS